MFATVGVRGKQTTCTGASVDCTYTHERVQTAVSHSLFTRQSLLTVMICDARVLKYSRVSQVREQRVKDAVLIIQRAGN